MKRLMVPLVVILILAFFVHVAVAQDSPVASPTAVVEATAEPTAAPEPPPAPDLPPDTDDIVSDIVALVDQAGLGSLVSLLVMLLTYFNIIPDGWGGKVCFGVGVFVFVVTLALSADDAEYVFSLLRELVSLISLLLGSVSTHAGMRYLEVLPGRRGK